MSTLSASGLSAANTCAAGCVEGVLGYTDEEVVSSDMRGESCTSVFDAKAGLQLDPTFVKLVAWYDKRVGLLEQTPGSGSADGLTRGELTKAHPPRLNPGLPPCERANLFGSPAMLSKVITTRPSPPEHMKTLAPVRTWTSVLLMGAFIACAAGSCGREKATRERAPASLSEWVAKAEDAARNAAREASIAASEGESALKRAGADASKTAARAARAAAAKAGEAADRAEEVAREAALEAKNAANEAKAAAARGADQAARAARESAAKAAEWAEKAEAAAGEATNRAVKK